MCFMRNMDLFDINESDHIEIVSRCFLAYS